jgi:uncharacterized repeat protein (TIGR01451 family)
MSRARTLLAVVCPALLVACAGEPPTAAPRAAPQTAVAGATSVGAAARIAFASNRDAQIGNFEIWTMAPDGGSPLRLTSNGASDSDPAQSPDGSKILFTSERDANREIYVMSADGSGPTNLTNSAGADFRASWSPDGGKIAFTSDRDGDNEIYVMNADGSGVVRLTDNLALDASPAWSPDGSKIAFVSNRDGNLEIYVMHADGAGQANLTNNSATENDPAWSPNGRIAFTSNRAGGAQSHVWVMDADGGNAVQLTSGMAVDDQPAWSPDGTRIAFVRRGDVWVMDANGANSGNISKDESSTISNENPDWGVPTTATAPNADLAMLGNAGRGSGKTVVYTFSVQNLGPDGASDVRLTSVLPTAARFVSINTTQGSCSTPPVGSSGSVACALGAVADGGKVTTQITVKVVPANARPSVGASVTSATLDPVPTNNSATVAAP